MFVNSWVNYYYKLTKFNLKMIFFYVKPQDIINRKDKKSK